MLNRFKFVRLTAPWVFFCWWKFRKVGLGQTGWWLVVTRHLKITAFTKRCVSKLSHTQQHRTGRATEKSRDWATSWVQSRSNWLWATLPGSLVTQIHASAIFCTLPYRMDFQITLKWLKLQCYNHKRPESTMWEKSLHILINWEGKKGREGGRACMTNQCNT